MATQKGKDQRDRIIREAFRCIYKYGLMKTNAGLISEKLKAPPSLFFYYFPKQVLLYSALIERILESNRAQVINIAAKENAQTPWEHLQVYIKGNLSWAVEYPEHVAVLIYGILDVSAKSDIRNLVTTALQTGEDRIYHLITEGMALKTFQIAPETHPREVARLLHQQVFGSIVHIHAFREQVGQNGNGYVERGIALAKSLVNPTS